MNAAPQDVRQQIERLESQILDAYQSIGISRTPLKPVDLNNPKSVELHLAWIDKELRGLRRIQDRRERSKPGFGERLRRLTPRALSAWIASLGLSDPTAEIDEFGADRRSYERLKPLIEWLFVEYFRTEVDGVGHVPSQGAALLVANHGGLLPFDALMLRYATEELHPAGRTPRFLIEDWFMAAPVISLLLQRLGAIRGSQDNAARLLERGHLVGIFPEGSKGVTKPYRDRYRVQRFGRGGVIRLALRHRVPIVPVGVVGAEELYPLIGRAEFGGRSGNSAFLPITPLFPWLGPLGFTPLPSKWMIRYGEPLDLSSFDPSVADDDITVNTLNEELRQRVQDLVNAGLQRRRSPWLG